MDQQVNSNGQLIPLNHLALIAVSGQDNANFLQGQLSCDINALADLQASLAAFCNPKGRVISTLLVLKFQEMFWLILPAGLVDSVLQKLQRYVLRAKVSLNGSDAGWQLFGWQGEAVQSWGNAAAAAYGLDDALLFKLPWSESRYLGIARQLPVAAEKDRNPGMAESWQYLDVSARIPWFEVEQSELYTPQMLNLDQLGGVSFAKGCYTGQEIIARTFYLGKAKRHLFLAETPMTTDLTADGLAVLDAESQRVLGRVLVAQCGLQQAVMLVVLQDEDAQLLNLILDDARRTIIKIADVSQVDGTCS